MMVFSFVFFDCLLEVVRMDGIILMEEGSFFKIFCIVEIKMYKVIVVVDERFLFVCMFWRNCECWKFDFKWEVRLIVFIKVFLFVYM